MIEIGLLQVPEVRDDEHVRYCPAVFAPADRIMFIVKLFESLPCGQVILLLTWTCSASALHFSAAGGVEAYSESNSLSDSVYDTCPQLCVAQN